MPFGDFRTVALLLIALPCAAQQPAQAPVELPAIMFHSQTRLVLLSFHVIHGKNYVPDLKASDVVLLEDGKPRNFTIFDSPATHGRMPLELVLLFDTNRPINYFWDANDVFRFVTKWDDAMTRTVLDKTTADIRISVYRCAEQKLFRLSPASSDEARLTTKLRGILNWDYNSQTLGLTLPPKRDSVGYGPFTNDYPTSYFISSEYRGWPMEAAIGTLNDVALAQDKVSRVFVMFSEGIGATTTVPEDVGNEALDLGIPIYPVATNYQGHIRPIYPRNLFRMNEFKALGKMTGGRSMEYTSIDAPTLLKILTGIKNDGLSQYVIGFVPSAGAGDAKPHKLEVKLAVKSSGNLEGGKRSATY